MSSNITDVVQVTISRDLQVPSTAGFGTAAFISADTTHTTVVVYNDLATLQADDTAAGADTVAFAVDYWGQGVKPTKLTLIPDGLGSDLPETLDLAVDDTNDWYVVAASSDTAADIVAISGWVDDNKGSNPKLYFVQTDDPNTLDSSDATDPASVEMAAQADRSSVWYKADGDQVVAGILGKCLPTVPGSITWSDKNLVGITPDKFTGLEKSAAFDKRCNLYYEIANVAVTRKGQTAGEWIDVMRGVDWIQAQMQLQVFTFIQSQPKVPYIQSGLDSIENVIRNVLDEATANGILSPDTPFKVNMPTIDQIPAIDKANRLLQGVTFEGTVAGAIQKVIIQGTVSY